MDVLALVYYPGRVKFFINSGSFDFHSICTSVTFLHFTTCAMERIDMLTKIRRCNSWWGHERGQTKYVYRNLRKAGNLGQIAGALEVDPLQHECIELIFIFVRVQAWSSATPLAWNRPCRWADATRRNIDLITFAGPSAMQSKEQILP